MILDERSYDVLPARVGDYLALYEAEGMAIQIRHLGELVGFFTVDVGVVNRVVHIWRYDSLADREARRANLDAGADWLSFKRKATPMLLSMTSRILRPARFSPMR